MATLQEYLEQDKEKLLADLQQAKSPEKTQEVLGRELDRMLIRYNEDCAVPDLRDAAAYMLQTARKRQRKYRQREGEKKCFCRPDGDFRYGRHHLRDHCPGDEFQCSGG